MSNQPPAVSPVMAQYHDIKNAYPGCLLFFRMGDFYELFFADAEAAALIVLVLAAAEAVIGLGLALAVFRRKTVADVETVAELRG